MIDPLTQQEKSACGVGFMVSLKNEATHEILQKTLKALACNEHRGACAADQVTADGSGIMTDIPLDIFGYEPKTIAVATLFLPMEVERSRIGLRIFEQTFSFFGMNILEYREVPVCPEVLGEEARQRLPKILHAVIQRPDHCRTHESFDRLLYNAKQLTCTKQREQDIYDFYFTSLSANTIIYKGLVKAETLAEFYPDLKNPAFKTRFALFHRRFSTNTSSSWDKAQPFRILGHNGEINAISGNRAWARSREKSLGLPTHQLISSTDVSDSASLNEIVEAIKYISGMENMEEIMAIMMPSAHIRNSFYKFWSRTMEPWDGPAFVAYSDGQGIGARLDRNGFRPCRWAVTEDHFYLSSEAGSFSLDESKVLQKGTLHAGTGVKIDLEKGTLDFNDPGESQRNYDANYESHLIPLDYLEYQGTEAQYMDKRYLFQYTDEDVKKILQPMITKGKEPIGSMGDTARLAIFSDQPRPLFDYFYHNFAQVTNPPLDYLRERVVTDLHTYLGVKPNIFNQNELLPPKIGIELPSPIIGLGQMEYLRSLTDANSEEERITARELDISFKGQHGVVGMKSKLKELAKKAVEAADEGDSVLILSDREADYDNPPIPALLALRSVIKALHQAGENLSVSVLMDTGQVRTTHQAACLIGFGASAVCPYLPLEMAHFQTGAAFKKKSGLEKEQNLLQAFNDGLMKIMSKMGISVVRSYQSAKIFAAVGINKEVMQEFFPGVPSYISGIGIEEICEDVLRWAEKAKEQEQNQKLINTYQFKENEKGEEGERHAMTAERSKIVHELVRKTGKKLSDMDLWDEYLKHGGDHSLINFRNIFSLKPSLEETPMEEIEPIEDIMKAFGSGAMSFGAISAESQRDIFLAMRAIGGRSNSGEGGENPYYYTDGISASTKQVASARFGVNALFLIDASEIQIKIAQGAKPGEGGQLMGKKVDEHIAFARHASEGVDLISPPPLHDIYSIEDLRQLIYELKQVNPNALVNVKLVSGAHIGTIAVGVAKAGADVIHIAGGDGGTGAAPLSSMKHAGLPWEIGLTEVHRMLVENNLRKNVFLRTDGGLHSGRDIVMAALLGADHYEFGKLMLVAEGCVMARICEKNTCPTGIATHQAKFKENYEGKSEHIIRLMEYIAEDVRRNLAHIGARSLKEVVGRSDLLEVNQKHAEVIAKKKLDLSGYIGVGYPGRREEPNQFFEGLSEMNQRILADTEAALRENKDIQLTYEIATTDRAAVCSLAGAIAATENRVFKSKFDPNANPENLEPYTGTIKMDFYGSAGQSFAAYAVKNLQIHLWGEANDGVCKTMSGGRVVIQPRPEALFKPEDNVIIGNCALYGATGGTLYVKGHAGDRFAVRNSGSHAVVEGAGLHCCEYMTSGRVIVLGDLSDNIGGGMTGGEVMLPAEHHDLVNEEYLTRVDMDDEFKQGLKELLEDYHKETSSETAKRLLDDFENELKRYNRYLPLNVVEAMEKAPAKGEKAPTPASQPA